MPIQQAQSASNSSLVAKSSAEPCSSVGEGKTLPTIAEDYSNEFKCSVPSDLLPSSSSLSTLTSISASTKDNSKNFSATHPSVNLKFLQNVHKRTKRKQRLRKVAHIFHLIFVYCLPIGGMILGITGILLGHFLHIEPIFVGSCLLLISTFGLILQSCFWKRSVPNKFRAKEIPFNMPQEDSLLSESTEQTKQDPYKLPCDRKREQPLRIPSMNSAQFRRLSMALNRATAELTAARQITPVTGGGSGVLNLARRLTLAPIQFGDYGDMREHESGNGWIAGRFPQGVRRGLAWNDTGASRFYASNYD